MRAGISNIKGNLYTGGWQLIYENLLTSAATSVTISGLDGNTDKEYRLVCRIVNGYAGYSNYLVRLNNDSGANYGRQIIYGVNATASAYRGTDALYMGYANNLNYLVLGEILIFAKSGYVRTVLTKDSSGITGTTVTRIGLTGGSWNNTADNITSLVVLADQTNGLGIGSHILLFARRIKQTTQLEGSLELYKGKLQAGVMQTIYETTLTEAATSITISGLDGDTDILYELECRFVNGYAGGVDYLARLNNDSGANYGYQYLNGADTVIGVARSVNTGLFVGYISAIDKINFMEKIIYAKSGYVRTAITKVARNITGTTIDQIQILGESWNNTSDNITSIVLVGNTNCLGIGTYIRLKALRKVL